MDVPQTRSNSSLMGLPVRCSSCLNIRMVAMPCRQWVVAQLTELVDQLTELRLWSAPALSRCCCGCANIWCRKCLAGQDLAECTCSCSTF